MILYTLACDAGHRFDSWFRDSAAYDDQHTRDVIACPVCDSSRVAKAMMAPAIVGERAIAAAPAAAETTLLDDKSRALRALLRDVRDKVVAEGDNVGVRFPEVARAIHEGEAPKRAIYGEASVAEVRDLIDDGIMVMPLPIVPDELN